MGSTRAGLDNFCGSVWGDDARGSEPLALRTRVVDECGLVFARSWTARDGTAILPGACSVQDWIFRRLGVVRCAVCCGSGDGADAAGEQSDAVDCADVRCGISGCHASGCAVSVVGYLSICVGRHCAACAYQSVQVRSGRSSARISAAAVSGDLREYQSEGVRAHDLSADRADDLLGRDAVLTDGCWHEDCDVWVRVRYRDRADCAAEAHGTAADGRAAVCVVSAAGVGDWRGRACGCGDPRVCIAGAAVPASRTTGDDWAVSWAGGDD